MTYATLDPGTKLRPQGGMTSPYTRRLVVDSGEKADYAAIQAAIDFAVASGASLSSPYLIEVGPGDYAGFTAPAGVFVLGAGRWHTVIEGAITMHAGSGGQDFTVYPPAGALFWLHFIGDLNLGRTSLINVHGHIDDNTVDGTVVGVKVSGTGTSVLQAWGCFNQVENKSAGGSADIRLFHILTGTTNVYVEWYGGQWKTNAGTATARHPVAVEVRGTGLCYVRPVAVEWYAARAISVRRLDSTNPNHPGLHGDVPIDHDGNNTLEIRPDITGMVAYPRALLTSRRAKTLEVDTFVDLVETTDATLPAANTARVLAKDNGAGSTQLFARFASGADVPLATQGVPAVVGPPGMGSARRYTTEFRDRVSEALVVGEARYSLLNVTEARAFTQIWLYITGSAVAGAVLHLAIFNTDAHGRPSTRVAYLGAMNVSTGLGVATLIATSPVLQPGRYAIRSVLRATGNVNAYCVKGTVAGMEQPVFDWMANGWVGDGAADDPAAYALPGAGNWVTYRAPIFWLQTA